MKIIEKLKKWIAGFTAASLVLAMMPVLPAQAALLDAPKRPVASVLGGYYSGPKTVSLTTDAKACTYYVKNTVSGIFAPGKFDLNDFLSSREASQYNAEEGITIDADHAQSVVLRGLSFFPKTEEDCTLKLSNIKRWTLPSFMEPQVYVFDKVAPNVLINGEAPKAVYGSKDLVNPLTITYNDSFDVASTGILDGGAVPSGTQLSTNGTHTITVTDHAQNVTSVSFLIDTEAPAAPVNLSPENESVLNSKNLTEITWGSVVDLAPVTYQYQSANQGDLSLDGSFTSPVYTSGWQKESEIPTPNTPEGIYYWHVRAKDGADNVGPWSTAWMITVDNTAPVVANIFETDSESKTNIIGENVKTNKPISVTAEAMDYFLGLENIGGINKYEWTSSSAEVMFSNVNSSSTEIEATEDGTYEISLVVTDKAGNSSEVKKFELTWDTTVNSVEDFKAVVAGDGKVDLSWTDPEDEDLAGLEIFRSTEEGVLGESLEKVKTGVGKYVDSLVIPGQTYYYTVVAIDELGNKSEENAQLKIVLPVLATVTTEPTTPVAPTQEVTTYSTPKKVAETPVTPEVKGGNTNEAKGDEKKEDDNSRTLSAFGIGLLAVLALVGLYLLYLQNPDWFAGLAFWKKKQVKKNGKKLKR